jgi:hypothetical protein
MKRSFVWVGLLLAVAACGWLAGCGGGGGGGGGVTTGTWDSATFDSATFG